MTHFQIAPHFEAFKQLPEAKPQSVEITVVVETLEQAQAIAAAFPKSLNVKANRISGYEDGKVRGFVSLRADLRPTKAVGSINETGIRRYRRTLEKILDLGHTFGIKEQHVASNQYPDLHAFHAAVGISTPISEQPPGT